MNETKFTDLPLSEELLRAVKEMGFEEPTPIQAQAIPHLIEGRDLLGQAQTGTGKTCAFGIPIIESTDTDDRAIQHLILSPTRELAMQIADELNELARYKSGIRILAIYGGQPMDRQLTALKKHPQIIVGTPGRVMDHMRRRTLKLDELQSLVLDEADEMLNMGFKEDIDTILTDTPASIQRVLFSATMPRSIMELTETYLNDPIQVVIKSKTTTVSRIDQSYIELRDSSKTEVLCRLIEAERIRLALIFCNTKNRVDELTSKLQTRGYAAEGLHGDMNQRQRTTVMNAFKQGRTEFLIATDVAARGIDVDDIEMVINYDLPGDAEYYTHRIGRTGRAGRSGKAVTFVVGRELMDLRRIAKVVKADIRQEQIPSIDSIQETRISAVIAQVTDRLKASEEVDANYADALMRALDELNMAASDERIFTMTDIAAAFLAEELSERQNFVEEIEPVVPYDEYLKRRSSKSSVRSRFSTDDDAKRGGGRNYDRKRNRHEGKRRESRPADQAGYKPRRKASYAGESTDYGNKRDRERSGQEGGADRIFKPEKGEGYKKSEGKKSYNSKKSYESKKPYDSKKPYSPKKSYSSKKKSSDFSGNKPPKKHKND